MTVALSSVTLITVLVAGLTSVLHVDRAASESAWHGSSPFQVIVDPTGAATPEPAREVSAFTTDATEAEEQPTSPRDAGPPDRRTSDRDSEVPLLPVADASAFTGDVVASTPDMLPPGLWERGEADGRAAPDIGAADEDVDDTDVLGGSIEREGEPVDPEAGAGGDVEGAEDGTDDGTGDGDGPGDGGSADDGGSTDDGGTTDDGDGPDDGDGQGSGPSEDADGTSAPDWATPTVQWDAPIVEWEEPTVRWSQPEVTWPASMPGPRPRLRWDPPQVVWSEPEVVWAAPTVDWPAPTGDLDGLDWASPTVRWEQVRVIWSPPTVVWSAPELQIPPGADVDDIEPPTVEWQAPEVDWPAPAVRLDDAAIEWVGSGGRPGSAEASWAGPDIVWEAPAVTWDAPTVRWESVAAVSVEQPEPRLRWSSPAAEWAGPTVKWLDEQNRVTQIALGPPSVGVLELVASQAGGASAIVQQLGPVRIVGIDAARPSPKPTRSKPPPEAELPEHRPGADQDGRQECPETETGTATPETAIGTC